MNELLFKSIYKTENSIAYPILKKYIYAQEIIPCINNIIKEAILSLGDDFCEVGKDIFIHRGAHIAKNATILSF